MVAYKVCILSSTPTKQQIKAFKTIHLSTNLLKIKITMDIYKKYKDKAKKISLQMKN
jgi:hypothetical protein